MFCFRGMGWSCFRLGDYTTVCLLDLLQSGNMMMADKGINIQDLVAKRGTNKINVPPKLTTKKEQMPVLDAE